MFGNRLQVWNRDIDRLAPAWLIDALVEHTGTPRDVAYGTTLRVFDGILYPSFRATGHLPWVLTMQMYHRRREGFAQQYCPVCISQDPIPYFRKTWRLALQTFCIKHMCQLHDRCYKCGAGISFHRMDMGQGALQLESQLSTCHACKASLNNAPMTRPPTVHDGAFGALCMLNRALNDHGCGSSCELDSDYLRVLRHLVSLLLSRRRKLRLMQYLAELFDQPVPAIIGSALRPSVEAQSTSVRHTLLLWTAWILCDPTPRLADAYLAGAFLHNHLLRDFEAAPKWYLDVVSSAAPARRATAGFA